MLCVAVVLSCLLSRGTGAWAITAQMALPEHWGVSSVAAPVSPVNGTVAPAPVATAPEAQDLMLIPRGRLIVGSGKVDPRHYLQQRAAMASSYVLKASQAGIVEYLHPRQGFFAAGFPLVRLYELGIIPDLAKAEAAARHYLDQPFTIAGPQREPPDFPSPTVSAEMAAALPPARPAARPQAEHPPNPGGLQQQQRSGGLRVERTAAPAARSTEPDLQKAVAELAEQLQGVRSQLTSKREQQADAETQLGPLQARLEQAAADLSARKSLYERGILAANALNSARAGHQQLEAELLAVEDRCRDLGATIGALGEQERQLEATLQEARAAAEAKPAVTTPARNVEAPRPRTAQVQPRPPAAAASSTVAAQPQPDFPAPTVTRLEPAVSSRADTMGRSIERLNAREQQTTGRRRVELAPIPEALTRLGEPRWETIAAPTGGVVVQQLTPDGEQVEPGRDLLRIANTQWARIYADLSPEYLGQYRQGSPVIITFDEYPDTRFEGWINSLSPTDDGQALRAELYVICTGGYWGTDAYAMLRWLAGAAPLQQDQATGLQPVTETVPEVYSGHCSVYALLPIVPAEYGPGRATAERTVPGQYVGYMQAAQLEAAARGASASSEDAKQRLEKLAKWRSSFTEGMTTTIFANRLVLTYPAEGEIRRAVEKMATGQVSNVTNRCARTMAEALGWGLGDAAQWAPGLPRKGYKLRDDGLCRPGDILVWPFTFGPGRTQHVGIAVLQGGRMMMLSNLSGRLGTSEILPGYLAFHKPPMTPAE